MKTITKLKTSLDCYLTARTALNIDSPEMTGDWNFHNYFVNSPYEYYIEQAKNTPWGQKGVIEVSDTLNRSAIYSANLNSKHIYAADHYRALADLFFNRVKNNKPVRSLLFSVNDWLNTQKEKERLYNEYLNVLDNAEIDTWFKNATNLQ